jgi:hypothetical protein
VGDEFDEGEGLGFGDGVLAGAFQDEIPGVGVGELAGAVEGGAEAGEEGPVAQVDVGDVAAVTAASRDGSPA